ncbi:hypothetical protein DFH09DRAFT_1082562 [Mycena vulgaris]|nr:hypothetical protein DFH09DRAFT_1082562 [Mycena vulgaris]
MHLSVLPLVSLFSAIISAAAFPTTKWLSVAESVPLIRPLTLHPGPSLGHAAKLKVKITIFADIVADDRPQADSISRVKFVQDARVSAHRLVAHRTDPKDNSSHSKDLVEWMAIGTQKKCTLADEGMGNRKYYFSFLFRSVRGGRIREQPLVRLTVLALRRKGTAFNGWFVYMGLYDVNSATAPSRITHNTFQASLFMPISTAIPNIKSQADSIARVQYVQDAAVSAYLIARWTDPRRLLKTRHSDTAPDLQQFRHSSRNTTHSPDSH